MANGSAELYEKLARLGFAARGVVYSMIGGLAVMTALGSGGDTAGSAGALASLTGSLWGQMVLAVTAVGLFGYGLWRLVSAGLDLENEGRGKKALAKRAAHGVSGLFHFGLAIYAAALVFGGAGSGSSASGGGGAQSAAAQLMQAPAGPWLVGIAAAIAVIVAGFQTKKAVAEDYRAHVKLPDRHGLSNKLIKFGILARAAVFAIIGGFLFYAALTANPQNARGIGGALAWLQNQSYGDGLLGLIGAGLLGFALYSFLQARYRTIPDPEHSRGKAVGSSAA